jgi:hypothetical protein
MKKNTIKNLCLVVNKVIDVFEKKYQVSYKEKLNYTIKNLIWDDDTFKVELSSTFNRVERKDLGIPKLKNVPKSGVPMFVEHTVIRVKWYNDKITHEETKEIKSGFLGQNGAFYTSQI